MQFCCCDFIRHILYNTCLDTYSEGRITLTDDPSKAEESYGDPDVLDAVDTVSKTLPKIIFNPPPEGRKIQSKVYAWLKSHAKPSPFSTWGVSNGWDLITEWLNIGSSIRLDLESTYETITFTRVVGLFRSLNMPMPLAHAAECCMKGSLMRGGIPSNYILELILRRMDMRLGGIANEYYAYYRRYVDDLFFFHSLDKEQVHKALSSITSIIEDEGFALNSSKTKVVL